MRTLIIVLILSGLLCLLGNAALSSAACLPRADLIKGSGPEVYLIELEKKRWIPSPRIFTRNGLLVDEFSY